MPHNDGTLTAETRPAVAFSADTLDQIMRLEASIDGLLSVYLLVDPAQAEREGFEAALLDLWKPVRAQMRATDLAKRLEEEIERVNAYVRSWDVAPGRSAAIFSCAPLDVFLCVALDVPVSGGARFGPRPYLVPLIGALDEYERYGVVLVSKDQARIVTVWMGRIEERIEFRDVVPGRSAMGNWAQARFARHREYHVHEHMRRVVDELWRLSRRRAFDRLIIGGPDEAMATLRPMLPRSLASKVVGEFTGEMFAADSAIVERVRAIEEAEERAREVELVTQVLDRAASGGLAAVGWDDTLMALSEGRLHRLVLAEGATVSGVACAEGHLAVSGGLEVCPYCEEPTLPVADLAAAAVRLAMATGAGMELVRGEAAGKLRPHAIGAILRY